jgi:signal transduction histidine kinase
LGLLVKDGSDQVTGVTGVLRDVTERKRVEALQARQREQLRDLAGRLASAQDEEQRRIAQGLHDDVAQILTACSLKLAVAGKAPDPVRRRALHDEIDDLLAEATEKIRSLSFELYSSALRRLGLGKGLEELCDDMSDRFGVAFEFTGPGQLPDLESATETVLFKNARELLFNVVKHAGVREATVSLIRGPDTLSLLVEDRGVGFPETPEEEHVDLGKGLGLFGVRERMLELGGGMRIETVPGRGTRVTLSLPLRGTGAGYRWEGNIE